ncbi:Spo0B domain-containing protein [Aquisalibacillus elongatus]|uniref:Sensor kinase SpoOB-type protein n=1 Tax=Aquisalibacillus elongatus TaxID=485577 RepID=A0A3N5BCR8_9BACI|nr:Spo0B domain-containing protein [Aquisalibacillus elongatus]RPF55506.1 sensor kinase SpoOB-type protein [Aquisalibacillus elongatus]
MKVEVEELLALLRLYRHDLMNDLQLVQGYASMNKHDLSKEKLDGLISKLREERTLQTLHAPQFVYWLIQLKLNERETRFEFEIESHDHSIGNYDEELVLDGKMLMDHLRNNLGSLAELHITLRVQYNQSWYIQYDVSRIDLLNNIDKLSKTNLEVKHNKEVTSFEFSYR